MLAKTRYLLQLTKPSIMLLVVITGAAGLAMERSLLARPLDFVLVLLGLFLTGGSANALNQYFERELDGRMSRTRTRRPLPTGKLSAPAALTFAVGIGAAGVALFAWRFTWLSAGLALATVLFYGLFYTLWLKPHTAQNIVIGGAAGAMAPVIAWAAAAGNLALAPWLLFLVILLWTPPHFWALALYYQEDYRAVGLPMMPLVRGAPATLRLMFAYTLATVALSLLLVPLAGLLYAAVALALGAIFVARVWQAWRDQTRARQFAVFKFSIVYLLALFAVLLVTEVARQD